MKVLKIKASYFEIEDFWSEFCLEVRGLFCPILAKKVLYEKKSISTPTQETRFELLMSRITLSFFSGGAKVGKYLIIFQAYTWAHE